jgi:hypothetical protein
MFGFGIPNLYASITQNVKEANDMLVDAFSFAQVSAYDVINAIPAPQSGTMNNILNAIRRMALVIETLLLMVEFFRKTVNFEWSSKWENILMFLIKIIVIKQVVQNADVIVGYIYSGFNSINEAATGGVTEFLPYGRAIRYYKTVSALNSDGSLLTDFFGWFTDIFFDVDHSANYDISHDAVRMFYPDAYFNELAMQNIDLRNLDNYPFLSPVDSANFLPLVENVLLQPYFWIVKGIAILVFIITIGRVFELALYTVFAPLPLATFASDSTHDVAKSFLKNYIGTVLQVAMIVVMFMVYVGLNAYINSPDSPVSGRLIQFVILITLGLGVFKSGAWSKKICGGG